MVTQGFENGTERSGVIESVRARLAELILEVLREFVDKLRLASRRNLKRCESNANFVAKVRHGFFQ